VRIAQSALEVDFALGRVPAADGMFASALPMALKHFDDLAAFSTPGSLTHPAATNTISLEMLPRDSNEVELLRRLKTLSGPRKGTTAAAARTAHCPGDPQSGRDAERRCPMNPSQESERRNQESDGDLAVTRTLGTGLPTPSPAPGAGVPTPPLEPERYELFEEPRYEFEPDRRDFLRIVGSGIVVCLVPGESQAQQRGSSGANVLQLGSWLHISETGQVIVHTGKVELGQNIRTSLSQVVAEELGLPVAAIRLVMADTEMTPHDPGTFGSLTTPFMGSELRRVAAAAREMLIDLAAEKAQVVRASLAVADGKVTHLQSKRSFTFGELTNGKRLKKTVGPDVPVTPARGWQVAGTSVPKVDGRAFVTGKHRFASDLRLPAMLHGKVLRPATLNATLEAVNL
jgi:hypothetical protein